MYRLEVESSFSLPMLLFPSRWCFSDFLRTASASLSILQTFHKSRGCGGKESFGSVVVLSELSAFPWMCPFAFQGCRFHNWLCQLWLSFVSTVTASLQRAFFERTGTSTQKKDFLPLPYCSKYWGYSCHRGGKGL